nr:glutamine synthetase [Candidatus Methylacidithermus pantelleriae]
MDFTFTDLPGTWQHFTTTLSDDNEDIFTEGLGFDRSNIRGWKASMPRTCSSFQIPPPRGSTSSMRRKLSLICTIVDPIAREPYDSDLRGVAEKSRSISEKHRHRRHRVLRARGGVLHLRRGVIQLQW